MAAEPSTASADSKVGGNIEQLPEHKPLSEAEGTGAGSKDVPAAQEGKAEASAEVVAEGEAPQGDAGREEAGEEGGGDGDGEEGGEEEGEDGEGEEEQEEDEEEEEEQPFFPSLGGGWSFGGIVKAIASKSEEVLREYQAELQEFGRELKKETEEFVETTTHTVKDLPGSLETGAQVAQSSLEGIGHTVEEFGTSIWKGTTDIINQVKEAIAAVDEEALRNAQGGSRAVAGYTATIQKGKYSRYEAQVSAMQRDSSTYCDEPEDVEEFAKWCGSFKLEDKKDDIDAILKENAFMQELQSRIVPLIVERETFWTRYFYRLHKLQQAEDARADLVKRATNVEEEDLSWDVDDDSEGATPKPEAEAGTGTAPAGEGEIGAPKAGESKEVEEAGESKEREAATGAAEEGAASSASGSSSSDWQVVGKEEEHGSVASGGTPEEGAKKDGMVAAPAEGKAASAGEEGKVQATEATKAPSEAATDKKAAAPASSKEAKGPQKGADGEKGSRGGGADEEVDEDWGEWE